MSFHDIKGQDKAVEILQGFIRESRMSNGYLFIGPEGIGKRMVAVTLAKALNCEQGPLDSCDRCASCQRIERNRHPDVYMVNGPNPEIVAQQRYNEVNRESTAVKIENIRQLQKDISLRPYEGRYKVFIIDNAHSLTAEASNALLKILEEPPPHSLIILITDKPTLLFKTIMSRCKVIKFYPLAIKKAMEILSKDYEAKNDFAHYLAYSCEGKIGQALGLKGTDVLREKNKIIDSLALSKPVRPTDLSIKSREEVRVCLNVLATWFRDIYLIKTGIPYSELINVDRQADLLKSIQHFSFVDLEQILNCVCDSISYLDKNINIKLLLVNLREEIAYRANRKL